MQPNTKQQQRPAGQHSPLKTAKGTELPLIDQQGKPYLQVAWRLVWFREEHPDWSIVTELVAYDEKRAVVRALVIDVEGRTIATGTKTQTAAQFPRGHVEKAETGAIGRALALCGYGTQFEPEIDEGDQLADAPVDRPSPFAGLSGRMLKAGTLQDLHAIGEEAKAARLDERERTDLRRTYTERRKRLEEIAAGADEAAREAGFDRPAEQPDAFAAHMAGDAPALGTLR